MKLNNKGFAISGVLYSLLILFVTLFIGILTILATTKFSLDKVKNDITNKLETLNYRDTILNGADPVLKKGMIPVTIGTDGTVKKADMKTAWYDYDTKMWANAVILDDNYQTLNSAGNVTGATKNDNGYVSFDGVDDHMNLGLKKYEFGQNATFAIRVKVNSTSGDARALINNFGSAGIGLYTDYASRFMFGIRFDGDSSNIIIRDSSKFELGRWYTIVGTYDGSTMNLYVDGQLRATKSISGTIKTSNLPIRVATNYDAGGVYRDLSNIGVATIDIYNRALTAEEVKNGYSSEIKIQNNEGLLKHVDFSNKTYNDNEIIPQDSISQYYTWVPRYKYRLWYVDAVDGGNGYTDKTKVHSIDIIFEGKNTAKSNGNQNGRYLTHPAFMFGDEELNGIWVGKFETGYNGATTTAEAELSIADSNAVIIKPNVYSWRNISISNSFYTALNLNKDETKFGLSSDSYTHMMKNTEWGAVTYLAFSRYGKDSEVYVNDNNNYLTGCAGDVTSDVGNSTCVDGYGTKTDGVYNQSTTGNISGIFDMSGGSAEYVMGYTTGALTKYGESGFTDATFPEDKYTNIYTATTSTQYSNRILGDATGEMGPFSSNIGSWHNDYNVFVYADYPWFTRGGSCAYPSNAGLTNFYYSTGIEFYNNSFRVVIS